MKIKKGIPLIDQHDKNGFYGGKFGGNYVAETLKKPIDDLTKLFEKCRKDKNFIKDRDNLYENYVGKPTRFIKLQNLTDHLGGAQIYAKMVSDANGGAHKIYNAITHAMLCKKAKKEMFPMQPGDVYETFADIEEIKKDYNYKPKKNIKEGIANFINWYKDYYST